MRGSGALAWTLEGRGDPRVVARRGLRHYVSGAVHDAIHARKWRSGQHDPPRGRATRRRDDRPRQPRDGEVAVALRQIRLELARNAEFPEGSAQHGYDFVA